MTTCKILDRDTLLEVLQEHRQKEQRIVTTNGCFDVLHVGHLRYLQAAKQIGGILVVLLNSDASVRTIKGQSRPVVPEDERAEMLAGLECVDYVAIFHEDTPIRLLELIRPNVHIKGAEYSSETLPEATILEGMGTELVFMPMIPGRSTTNIIQRIVETHQPV